MIIHKGFPTELKIMMKKISIRTSRKDNNEDNIKTLYYDIVVKMYGLETFMDR
jgi:hypothetical protein